MVNTPEPLDIQRYFKIGYRRKWYIIIPFTLAVAISFGVYTYLPKEYKATAVMWFQGPKVAASYVVDPTLRSSNPVEAITQEILSTRLESVIKEFNLYPDFLNKSPVEDIEVMMRKQIEVKINPKTDTFLVSFVGTDPPTVMKVTNRLASMFIEENLKSRELLAGGTVDFISKELQKAESNVKRGEDAIRRLKEKHMGELPEQFGVNLAILEQLGQQFKTASDNLRATEEKIASLQNEIEQLMDRPRGGLAQSGDNRSGRSREESLVGQLNALKQDLVNTELIYTESHPDVVNLKRKIAALELRVKKQEGERKRQGGEREKRQKELWERQEEMFASSPLLDPETEKLLNQYKAQLKGAQSEAKRRKEEMGNLKEQIARYQRRIEETPMREQEMSQLNRENERLRGYYQSLVDKKLQSQMAQNLELKRQGEQIRIFESARLPNRPFKPDFAKVLAIGAFLGLATGLGLAWVRESMDRSFYEVSEVEAYLKLPVLASILNLNEEKKAA